MKLQLIIRVLDQLADSNEVLLFERIEFLLQRQIVNHRGKVRQLIRIQLNLFGYSVHNLIPLGLFEGILLGNDLHEQVEQVRVRGVFLGQILQKHRNVDVRNAEAEAFGQIHS